MAQNILFLGPNNSPLLPWLQAQGEKVIQTSEPISAQSIADQEFGFLVSYGYRYILRKDILDLFPGRAINLHISYLPWNRGADPNFWSFIENTPKGVTIHYLDEGVDTGEIIVQQKISGYSNQDTLASSYEKLQIAIQDLFKQHWQNIKYEQCPRQKQVGQGSIHKTKDKENLSYLLVNGWETPISVLEDYATKMEMPRQKRDNPRAFDRQTLMAITPQGITQSIAAMPS